MVKFLPQLLFTETSKDGNLSLGDPLLMDISEIHARRDEKCIIRITCHNKRIFRRIMFFEK
jgi:hypothetical protein